MILQFCYILQNTPILRKVAKSDNSIDCHYTFDISNCNGNIDYTFDASRPFDTSCSQVFLELQSASTIENKGTATSPFKVKLTVNAVAGAQPWRVNGFSSKNSLSYVVIQNSYIEVTIGGTNGNIAHSYTLPSGDKGAHFLASGTYMYAENSNISFTSSVGETALIPDQSFVVLN